MRMSTQDSEHDSRGNVYEEYEQALFRVLMYEVAECEGKALQVVREQLKSQPDSLPGEQVLYRFREKLDICLSKLQVAAWRRKLSQLLGRAAVVVLVALSISFAATTTVQALKSAVMNVWMEIKPQFTIFRLQEARPGITGDNPSSDWTGDFVPTYLPEGYAVVSISVRESESVMVFEHEGSQIIYRELAKSGDPLIEREQVAPVENVAINDHDALLGQKDGAVIIIWEAEEHLLIIQAWTDRDTALKVARGVKSAR